MNQIQSLIERDEDAFVFSVLIKQNVGATKIADVETFDENGNATLETQSVDASRPDSDAIQIALNAVVAALNELGFDARANASPIFLNENTADGESARLVVDVALQKSTLKMKNETIDNEIEPIKGDVK